jgi:hypothetical protein
MVQCEDTEDLQSSRALIVPATCSQDQKDDWNPQPSPYSLSGCCLMFWPGPCPVLSTFQFGLVFCAG